MDSDIKYQDSNVRDLHFTVFVRPVGLRLVSVDNAYERAHR